MAADEQPRFDLYLSRFKLIIRDVVSPLVGIALAIQLTRGAFEPLLVPAVIGFSSLLIGVRFWGRTDERNRDDDGDSGPKRKKAKSITINWGGDDDKDAGS